MTERWHIVDTYAQNRVLQVCNTARQAQRAQRRWYKTWIRDLGPKTTIRRVAVRDDE